MTIAPDTVTDTTAPAPVAAANRPLAVTSLVLGILAIVSGFQIVLGIPAIIVGVLSLKQEAGDNKMAIAGIVTGAVSAAGVLWAIAGFAVALPFLPFLGLGLFW